MDYHLIQKLIETGRISEAEKQLENSSGLNEPGYWFLKARIYEKRQVWGEALNAYFRVQESDPFYSTAQINAELINGILEFRNPDMLNA